MRYLYNNQNEQLIYNSTSQNEQLMYSNNDPTFPFRHELESLKKNLAFSQEKNIMYENMISQYKKQIEQNENQLEFLRQIIKSTEAFEYGSEEEYDEDDEMDEESEVDDYEKDKDFIYDGPIEDDISDSDTDESEFNSEDEAEEGESTETNIMLE